MRPTSHIGIFYEVATKHINIFAISQGCPIFPIRKNRFRSGCDDIYQIPNLKLVSFSLTGECSLNDG